MTSFVSNQVSQLYLNQQFSFQISIAITQLTNVYFLFHPGIDLLAKSDFILSLQRTYLLDYPQMQFHNNLPCHRVCYVAILKVTCTLNQSKLMILFLHLLFSCRLFNTQTLAFQKVTFILAINSISVFYDQFGYLLLITVDQ